MARVYEIGGNLPKFARPHFLNPDGSDPNPGATKARELLEKFHKETACTEKCPLIKATVPAIAAYEKTSGPFSEQTLRNQNGERVAACSLGPLVCEDAIECQSEYTELNAFNESDGWS